MNRDVVTQAASLPYRRLPVGKSKNTCFRPVKFRHEGQVADIAPIPSTLSLGLCTSLPRGHASWAMNR
jgi:hypothetical protein